MYLFELRMQEDSDAMEAVFLRANNEKCNGKIMTEAVFTQADESIFSGMWRMSRLR